jgi:hypothetical protein
LALKKIESCMAGFAFVGAVKKGEGSMAKRVDDGAHGEECWGV